jgi:hypothetical protein
LETNKGEGERENPNTAFSVIETSRPEPSNSGAEKNPRVETRRPQMLNLLLKHRVTGVNDHPLIVDRILTVAKDEHIVQAFNEAARAKGGAPYDIGFYATIAERIAKAGCEAEEKLRAASDRAVQDTKAHIADQREKAKHAAPMSEEARKYLPRFGG